MSVKNNISKVGILGAAIFGAMVGIQANAASGVPVGAQNCSSYGSTTSDGVRTAGVCSQNLDYGDSVRPRYVPNVTCQNPGASVLAGEGSVVQDVIYITAQKYNGSSWQDFQLEINSGCSTRVQSGGVIHSNFF